MPSIDVHLVRVCHGPRGFSCCPIDVTMVFARCRLFLLLTRLKVQFLESKGVGPPACPRAHYTIKAFQALTFNDLFQAKETRVGKEIPTAVRRHIHAISKRLEDNSD